MVKFKQRLSEGDIILFLRSRQNIETEKPVLKSLTSYRRLKNENILHQTPHYLIFSLTSRLTMPVQAASPANMDRNSYLSPSPANMDRNSYLSPSPANMDRNSYFSPSPANMGRNFYLCLSPQPTWAEIPLLFKMFIES
jgi:hypothetical protein